MFNDPEKELEEVELPIEAYWETSKGIEREAWVAEN
jgi:hypothetical protein